ncbi:hypothetical protein [Ruegeria sp. SCP11]|uniref:hypothetical protein n=1 Tax=Ruegeria sp. SCP11 TaxID=3141378 RepID=UPI003338A620
MTDSKVSRPPIVRLGVAGKECFVGYYDVQPVSSDGEAILAHVTGVSLRTAQSDDTVSVGYFRRDGGDFVNLATTTLWCWQLGARLRWWPSERRALAFNAIVGGVPSFCVVREGAEPVRLCDRPLFDVTADGQMGIALNFGRLAWARPGYGYPALKDPFADEALPQRDGVTIVDMQSGLAELVYPMVDFARLLTDGDRDAFHYLNAASFSPTGKRFSVLYKRIPSESDIHNWQVDAVIGESNGSGIRRVPLPGRASHYWWLDDDHIVYTAISGWRGSYCLFDLRDGSIKALHPEAPGVDGHPSLHPKTGRWITDTYPDLFGEQVLRALEPDGSSKIVDRFPANPSYRDEWRCDLHPRWSRDGRSVVIDSTHNGPRALYVVDLTE